MMTVIVIAIVINILQCCTVQAYHECIDTKREQLNAVTAALLFILHSMKTQSHSSPALHFSSQQALLWSASLHSQSQHAAFALLLVLWPDGIFFTFLSA